MTCRQQECVHGLHNEFWWPVDGKDIVLPFSGKPGTNSPAYGRKARKLDGPGREIRAKDLCGCRHFLPLCYYASPHRLATKFGDLNEIHLWVALNHMWALWRRWRRGCCVHPESTSLVPVVHPRSNREFHSFRVGELLSGLCPNTYSRCLHDTI